MSAKDIGDAYSSNYYDDGSYPVLDKDELPVVLPKCKDCRQRKPFIENKWREIIAPKQEKRLTERLIPLIHLLTHLGIIFDF